MNEKWICVGDRLPDGEQFCAIVTDKGTRDVDTFSGEEWLWYSSDFKYCGETVEFWFPVPMPPKVAPTEQS